MNMLYRILIVVFIIGLSGCDNSSPSESGLRSISGYIEDDIVPNANVVVTDESGTEIGSVSANDAGLYSLDGSFEQGKTYYIKALGVLAGRNITMNGAFVFDEANLGINVNPLTELKYQLVNSGKSLEEAEALIREYFNIVKGKQLENNRFLVTDNAHIGMTSISVIYDGTLPIDAIEKIKNDIVRNAALGADEAKDYALRGLVKKELVLEPTATSLELGETVTVKLVGVESLYGKYRVVWSGIPEGASGDDFSKTFTINDAARDVYAGASVYKGEGDEQVLVLLTTTKVNFYKKGENKNITLSGIEESVSINEDITIQLPSDALNSISEITYNEIETNSNDFLKVFTLEPSGTVFSTPLEIRVKYDPADVYDPRLLAVKRVSNGVAEILTVKYIDYDTNELIFETDHFSTFIIEKDLNYFSYGDTSFEKWNERGVSGFPGDIKTKYAIEVKQNSPYHYLISSLDFYCDKKGVDIETCKSWMNFFKDESHAVDISDAYKEFFNQGKNYAAFNNNYYMWGTATLLPEFPGNNGNDAKGKYKIIQDYMFNDSIEGNRSKNFFSYMEPAFSANSFIYNKSNFLNTLGGINSIAISTSGLFNDVKNEDVYTAETVIVKKMAEYIGVTLLGKLPLLGDVYSEVFKYGLHIGDQFDNARFQSAYTNSFASNGTSQVSHFNEYFYRLTNRMSIDDNAHGVSVKYEVDKFGSLLKTENGVKEVVSKQEAKEMVAYLENSLFSSVDENKASKFLVNLYITLKNYTHIYFDDKYRTELLLKVKLDGAKAALLILQYADKVSSSEITSNKKANVNKSVQESIQRSITSNSNDIQQVHVLNSFDDFLEQIKLRIPESLFSNITIKKVSINVKSYDIEAIDSTSAVMPSFNIASPTEHLFSKNNVEKSSFSIINGKYTQNLASIFSDFDSSLFQNKFIVVKARFLVQVNGIDKVASKEYEFLSYSDDANELLPRLQYGKLSSSIKDAVTAEPIVDARITILPSDITNNTDETGNYTFSQLPPNTYRVQVAKEGYATSIVHNVELGAGQVKNLEIVLVIDDAHSATPGTATVIVKNAFDGSIITNGYVSVREGQNNSTGSILETKNNEGTNSIEFSLSAGTYTLESGANGYTQSFNTITILGDANITKELSISPVLEANQLRSVLSWGETPSDLDSHLVKKVNGVEKYHVYYSNQRPSAADANLDTDDTDSYGPETITINGADPDAVYSYYVHNFSEGSDTELLNSGAKVDVYLGNTLKTFYVPNEQGLYWKVFEIVDGNIIACTSGCVKAIESGIVRSRNREASLFQGLPMK